MLRIEIDAGFTRLSLGGIGATASRALLVLAIPAIGPFPHVANHIYQSIAVSRENAYRGGALVAI